MDAFLLLSLIALCLFTFGIYLWRGGYKSLYITRNRLPVVAPQAFKNILIPFGICMFVFALAMPSFIPKNLRDLFFDIGVVLFVLTLLLGIWDPRWLKPRWLVYLEDTYGRDFTQIILLPAAGDEPGWAQRMRTLEDVKMWAAEVAKQQGFPPET